MQHLVMSMTGQQVYVARPGQGARGGQGFEAVHLTGALVSSWRPAVHHTPRLSLFNSSLAVSHVTSSTLFCTSSLKVPTASLKRLSSRFCKSDRTAWAIRWQGAWASKSCLLSTQGNFTSSQVLHGFVMASVLAQRGLPAHQVASVQDWQLGSQQLA